MRMKFKLSAFAFLLIFALFFVGCQNLSGGFETNELSVAYDSSGVDGGSSDSEDLGEPQVAAPEEMPAELPPPEEIPPPETVSETPPAEVPPQEPAPEAPPAEVPPTENVPETPSAEEVPPAETPPAEVPPQEPAPVEKIPPAEEVSDVEQEVSQQTQTQQTTQAGSQNIISTVVGFFSSLIDWFR